VQHTAPARLSGGFVMTKHSSLICPVDFSEGSRAALRYAGAIASRFNASLTVLTVDDPLLTAVGDARMGEGWSASTTERELLNFIDQTLAATAKSVSRVDVRCGSAAPIILEAARQLGHPLIVMGTHGRSGVHKWMFGSVAERVLRETTAPVLLTPQDPGPATFDELVKHASPMLVPVDFSEATAHQVQAAATIAAALNLRMLVGHVIEPLDRMLPGGIDEFEISGERHRRVCRGLQGIVMGVKLPEAPSALIASGVAAEEIAQWVRDRRVGLLVMALHDSVDGAPRMGSVTYRAIAASHVLTLALPPARPS